MPSSDDVDDSEPMFWQTDGFTAPSMPPPLTSLFAAAGYAFTQQQREIILQLWTMLREGIKVLKYSHSGAKCHVRYLFCDEGFKILFWKETVRTSQYFKGHG